MRTGTRKEGGEEPRVECAKVRPPEGKPGNHAMELAWEEPTDKTKPFIIPEPVVREAFEWVRANKGAAENEPKK